MSISYRGLKDIVALSKRVVIGLTFNINDARKTWGLAEAFTTWTLMTRTFTLEANSSYMAPIATLALSRILATLIKVTFFRSRFFLLAASDFVRPITILALRRIVTR